MELASVYEPVKCGEIQGHSRVSVYGVTYDHDSTLVALSVQASSIGVEQIHYEIQGQDKHFTMFATGAHNRYFYPRKSHYRVIKAPIPDTSDISMIMLNDSLFKVTKDRYYTHVWYRGKEQFAHELFLRVQQIVYVPVREEWISFLYEEGTRTHWRSIPMCGEFTFMGPANKETQRNWFSAGFHIGYLCADREQWEKVISAGLKSGKITIS